MPRLSRSLALLLPLACGPESTPTLTATTASTFPPPDSASDPSDPNTPSDPSAPEPTGPSAPTEPGTSGEDTATDPTTPTVPTATDTGTAPDLPGDTDAPPACDGDCARVDLLIVVDNSSTTGEQQRTFTAVLPHLVARLRDAGADVNVLVTTTDFGHPLCTPFYKDGYTPAKGAPIATPCVDRLSRFTSLGGQVQIPDVCTDVCPVDQPATINGSVLHFAGRDTNVNDPDGAGDPAADALACLFPQGIDGCGFESPLETMLQALDPGKDWNQGPGGFLREGSTLAIVHLGDEPDCSTKDYAYFDPANKTNPDYNLHWEDLPDTPGTKGEPTSAICWNAGMNCTDANNDGTYESCTPADKGVLQPLARYTDHLAGMQRRVVMLALAGVPSVTAHNPDPPFEPTAGGVLDLVHRKWLASDILPGDPKTPQQKEYDFGIGPGCSSQAVGQALPPGRIAQVCQSLDAADQVHCCLESACDSDYTGAIDCLLGVLSL